MKRFGKFALVCAGLALGFFGLSSGALAGSIDISTEPGRYTVTTVPGPGYVNSPTIVSTEGLNGHPYVNPAAGSVWVTPTNAGGQEQVDDFTINFHLSASQVPTASLSFLWSADNFGTSVFLNGQSLGITTAPGTTNDLSSYNMLYGPFLASNPFVAGKNTLTFEVTNYIFGKNPNFVPGNPVALDVGGAVTFANPSIGQVPEPSSFALLALGGLGLAFRAFRRRQTAV